MDHACFWGKSTRANAPRPFNGVGAQSRAGMMPRKRKSETDKQRIKRLVRNAQQRQDAVEKEDDAIDAMVRQNIKLHGA